MKLSDFFTHLSYGVLSQYAIGTSDTGEIDEKQYPRMTALTNLGLTKLHSQLPLRFEQVLLQLQACLLYTSPSPRD